MNKLPEVEQAKALMTEAISWSVMKWLMEKKRVRQTADKANNALWALQKQVKTKWPSDLKAAYEELASKNGDAGRKRQIDAATRQLATKVKELDDEAWNAHMKAEETFDKAERILSTSLAREGCHITINSWELYEHAITKAEGAVRSTAA
jgi:hypothetical protein